MIAIPSWLVNIPKDDVMRKSNNAEIVFEEQDFDGFMEKLKTYPGIDYSRKEEIAAALLFYQYIGEKDNDFLAECNYSEEEAVDGIRRLAEIQGCDDILSVPVGDGV